MAPCPTTDQVDLYVDGELAPAEAAAFERHAAACPTCTAELALARQLTTLLQEPPCAVCPEPVLDAALAQIAHLERRAADREPQRLARSQRRFRTAVFALAASAAVAALAVIPLLRTPPAPAPQPTAAEIAQARSDVEYALSLVARSSERTGRLLRDDVLVPHVADATVNPILEALGVSE